MADSPAFQFYAADFLADENQRVMSPAEAGAYIRLICTCWIEGSVPDDIRRLAPLGGMTRAEMEDAWPQIIPCFEPHPDEPGRLIHPRVERERQRQRTYATQMAAAGKKGARRRWAKKKASNTKGSEEPEIPESDTTQEALPHNDENGEAIARLKPGHAEAIPTPMASDSSPASSSSLEVLTTSRPPVTRSEPDSQAMARPSSEKAGKREGDHEDRPAKPKHPALERLWTGGVMELVRRDWHRGQERVDLPDGKSVGIGLEYWLFNDLLHATDDPDMARWIVKEAPIVLGWDDQPRTLYWALRGQNFDAAFEAYLERHPPDCDPTAGMVSIKRIPNGARTA